MPKSWVVVHARQDMTDADKELLLKGIERKWRALKRRGNQKLTDIKEKSVVA